MYFGMSGSPFTTGLAHTSRSTRLSNTVLAGHRHPGPGTRRDTVGPRRTRPPGSPSSRTAPRRSLRASTTSQCIGDPLPELRGADRPRAGNSGQGVRRLAARRRRVPTTGTPLTGTGAAWYNTNNGQWKAINQRTGCRVVRARIQPVKEPLSAARATVPGRGGSQPDVPVHRRRAAGAGAIGATLVGPNHYPSAVVARFAAGTRRRRRCRSRAGRGAQRWVHRPPVRWLRPALGRLRSRDGHARGTMWLANEYIAQRCTSTNSTSTPPVATRGLFANWSTHITGIRPLS